IALQPGRGDLTNTLVSCLSALLYDDRSQSETDSSSEYKSEIFNAVNTLKIQQENQRSYLNADIICKVARAADLVSDKQYRSAFDTLNDAQQTVTVYLRLNPTEKDLLLLRSGIYVKLAVLSNNLGDETRQKTYLTLALADCITSIGNNKNLPLDVRLFSDTFLDIKNAMEGVFSDKEIFLAN